MSRRRIAGTIAVAWAIAAWISVTAADRRELDPEVAAVAPNPASPTASPQAVTVTGRNFVEHLTLAITTPSGAVMQYADPAITYQRDTSFQAMVTLAAAGAYRLAVTNPDGRMSPAFTLTVKSPAAPPSISGIEPHEPTKSMSPQMLTVLGAQFLPGLSAMVTDPAGAVATVNGNAIGQVSPTSAQITVTLELAGNYELVVTNPSGAVSNSFGFKVGGAPSRLSRR